MALLLAPTGASAAAAAPSWQPARKIIKIYPEPQGFVFFLDGAPIAPNSVCASDNRIWIPASYQNYDALVATIIAAYTTGKNIEVFIDAASTDCTIATDRVVVSG